MTFIMVSSLLLSIVLIGYHEFLSLSVINNNDNIINQKKQDGDGVTVLAYIAVIASLVLPHIPQIN